jgi:hypothetical protein
MGKIRPTHKIPHPTAKIQYLKADASGKYGTDG